MTSAFQSQRSPEVSKAHELEDSSTVATVLLIEDNPADVVAVQRSLKEAAGDRFEAVALDDLSSALQRLSGGSGRSPIQVVLLDLGLPDGNGVEAVQKISRHAPQVPIVVMTGLEDDDAGRQALRYGAQDYLCKVDLPPRNLVKSLDYAIERQQILRRLRDGQTHLEEQQAFLRSIVDASPTLMAVKDLSGCYVVANDALAALYGTTPEKMVGHRELYVNPSQAQARLHEQEEFKVAQSVQERQTTQEPCQDPDGGVRWLQSVRRPMFSQSGEVEWILVVMTDVTDREEAEQSLWDQVERSRLLGQLSHQIRESLQLPDILQKAANQVRDFLQVDRVMVYSLSARDGSGRLEVMDCGDGYKPGEDGGAALVPIYEFWSWTQGTVRGSESHDLVGFQSLEQIIDGVGNSSNMAGGGGPPLEADLTQIQAQIQDLKVRSILVVPILKGEYFLREQVDAQIDFAEKEEDSLEQEGARVGDSADSNGVGDDEAQRLEEEQRGRRGLWGLLVAHHCAGDRPWPPWEQDFLRNLSEHFAIAIQQATLYEQLTQANRKLEQLATMDGLTGIPNRRFFDQTLLREWKRSRRSQNPLALIVTDIDFFKPYNDHYGHLAGDDCLQQVAQALAKVAKRSTDLAFRYGGEEFAIILPETTLEGAIAVAQQVLNHLWELALEHAYSRVAKQVTLSLGLTSLIPVDQQDPDTLIQRADQALFMAKEAGRNRAIALGSTLEDLHPVEVLHPQVTGK
ncbi:MAG: diguanylate cyclase [Cyanobacteria bacterium P01_D01_bin.73]